jgi:pimeloyl-ACP methyl ester carboxylesterase
MRHRSRWMTNESPTGSVIRIIDEGSRVTREFHLGISQLLSSHATGVAMPPFGRPIEEGIRWVETGDGFPIALHYYGPTQSSDRLPIMMLHGLGCNRHNFDLFGHEEALPRQMARKGHPVYVVEVRGVGMSRMQRGDKRAQGIDAYLRHDLPAAVSYIRRTHQAKQIHWVGHSMGAILGYLYGAAFPEHVASLLAAAGPVPALVKVPFRRFLLPLRHMIRGRRVSDLEVPNRLGVRAARHVPRLMRLAYDKVLFFGDNMPDDFLVSFAVHGLENIPLSVLRRLGEWVTTDGPHAREVEQALSSLHVPTLFVAATHDPLCTPDVAEAASKLMPFGLSELVTVSRDHGFGCDFGHGDLLASHAAIKEVYPTVMRFIDSHEQRRVATATA